MVQYSALGSGLYLDGMNGGEDQLLSSIVWQNNVVKDEDPS